MNTYRVFFYKDLCNSDGHSFKCLQRRIDVQTDNPSQAQVLAGQLVDNERLNADCVEIMHLNRHHEFEQPADHSAAPCKHTWSRVAP